MHQIQAILCPPVAIPRKSFALLRECKKICIELHKYTQIIQGAFIQRCIFSSLLSTISFHEFPLHLPQVHITSTSLIRDCGNICISLILQTQRRRARVKNQVIYMIYGSRICIAICGRHAFFSATPSNRQCIFKRA